MLILINNQLPIENNTTPGSISLRNNFPNPFNNNTSIRFVSEPNKNIKLYITDIKGRLIKVLVDNKKLKGIQTEHWNGTNNLGVKVQSGIYFYSIEIEGSKSTKKMLLLK